MPSYRAVLGELYPMLAYIKEGCCSVGLNSKAMDELELACEEALVNIILYAYPSSEGAVEIILRIAEDQRAVVVTISDGGIPYNPLERGGTREINGERLGGYGIYCMIQLVDQIDYCRKGGSNILTLTKNTSPITPASAV